MPVTPTQAARSHRPYQRIAAATGLAAAVSAVLNTVIRQVTVTALDVPQPQYEPLHLSAVLTSSVGGAVAGGACFALVIRLTRRPMPVFGIVVAIVLGLSFIPVVLVNAADPPQYEGAGTGAAVALALMHVVVATALVVALRQAHGGPGRGDVSR